MVDGNMENLQGTEQLVQSVMSGQLDLIQPGVRYLVVALIYIYLNCFQIV